MAAPDSPIAEPSGLLLLLLPPLLMAVGIIVAVFLTLLALHFLLKRLHARNPPTAASTQQTSSCACLGVDRKVPVDSLLPVHAYSKDLHKFLLQHECCVCLSALEDGALVRILPACRHVFHHQCVDVWFASHSSCPLCRTEVVAAATEPPFVVPIDAGPARRVGLP